MHGLAGVETAPSRKRDRNWTPPLLSLRPTARFGPGRYVPSSPAPPVTRPHSPSQPALQPERRPPRPSSSHDPAHPPSLSRSGVRPPTALSLSLVEPERTPPLPHPLCLSRTLLQQPPDAHPPQPIAALAVARSGPTSWSLLARPPSLRPPATGHNQTYLPARPSLIGQQSLMGGLVCLRF